MIGFRHSKEDIKKTLDMAWPAMLESFFAAFAGLVDSLMVSSLGSYAVAAVGLTTQPKFLGLSLFIASNVAISALVARRKGEDKKEEANKIFSTFLVFLLAAAVLMSIVLVVFADYERFYRQIAQQTIIFFVFSSILKRLTRKLA